MTSVNLIRHVPYDDIENGVRLENPGLSAVGTRRTELLRDRLARTGEITADVLISSSLRRAVETANILVSALGKPVTLKKELEEWQCDDGSLSPEEFNAR
jgi:2,3-bisphosphoglycerate-dependent phosphoglycerate mutase